MRLASQNTFTMKDRWCVTLFTLDTERMADYVIVTVSLRIIIRAYSLHSAIIVLHWLFAFAFVPFSHIL